MTQYGEDVYILEFFKGRVGKFLDIGAGDGVTFSNTKSLLDNGWSGIVIEPSVSQLRWLIENHENISKVEILCAAVGLSSGVFEFWDSRDFSTLSTGHRDLIEERSNFTQKFRKRIVPVIALSQLLDIRPGPYQFLNIDVEALNLLVLSTVPLDQFEMVCIELDPKEHIESIKSYLNTAGMVKHTVVGGNLIAHR